MNIKVRETFDAFPVWSQPFWTWLTGKSSILEVNAPQISCWKYLLLSLLLFFGSILITIWIILKQNNFWIPLLITIPLTLTGSRLLILTIAHQCAHLKFCETKAFNKAVHLFLSVIVCSQDFESYRYDHFRLHHGSNTFGTFDDPVLSFIRSLGFLETMSRRRLWVQLAITCASPRFHAIYLCKRIMYNLRNGSGFRRFIFLAWWALIVFLASTFHKLIAAIVIGYLLPITILYQISAFLELICEHVWMRPVDAQSPRQRIVELCWGRFCGEPVPSNEGFGAWCRWLSLMVFYHLPVRLLVLVGDAPQHDFHHMVPNNRRWMVSAYERSATIRAGRMEDREVWGLLRAIDIVFSAISTMESHMDRVAYLEPSRDQKAIVQA